MVVATGGSDRGRAKEHSGRGPGLSSRLRRTVSLLSSVVSELDPDRLTGPDATTLYGSLAEVERLVVAGKALLSPRIDSSGVWKEGGHRDAASMLAELEGVSPGQAKRTLEVGQRLASLPGTEAVLRRGSLSGPKLTALSGAALADPTREAELLQGAESEPLAGVTERCSRVRAEASSADPLATLRAVHARRHFRSWTDPEGAFCYEGRDTADRGAKLLAHLDRGAKTLRRARRRAGERGEPEAALRADALFCLLTRPSPGKTAPRTSADDGDDRAEDEEAIEGLDDSHLEEGAAGLPGFGGPVAHPRRPGPPGPAEPVTPELQALIDRPPVCSVVVRVDLAALLRGKAEPGERCELDGAGPIPVTMARSLANDAFVALLYHRAGDIKAVAHLGRTINKTLRTALIERDRACVVPGCWTTAGLEIDHVLPFAENGPTKLDNLALLCHHHHHLKTFGGWTLTRTGTTASGRPTWSFTPDPPFGQEPDLGIDTPEGRADWLRRQRE
jgi:Domain of unknown function (DUF222)/HNH endonuclease